MAQAMVRFIQTYGKGGQNRQRAFYAVYFWGDDVPDAIDGQSYPVEVFMVPNWTLANLKTAVLGAVSDQATALGLTLLSSDIFLDTYETGSDAILQIPNLQVWLDSSKITGLVDGDPIGTWTDQSGNAYHATQGTASAKPIYKVAILNGRPAVRYDGVDDGLQVTLAQAQPITLFVVMQHATGSITANESLAVGSVGYGMFCRNTSPDQVSVFGGGTLDGKALDALPHVCMAILDGTSSAIVVDGALTAGNAGTNGMTTTIYIGGGNPYHGDLFEVLLWSRHLTTDEQASVRSSLGTKYNLVA